MAGLGAGITNSWIEQYTVQPTPCITNSTNGVSSNGTFSSCLLWLAIGLLVGSITFQKKGSSLQ